MEKRLMKKLRFLKNELKLIFHEKQSLTHPDVVAISQKMDIIITQLQNMKNIERLEA